MLLLRIPFHLFRNSERKSLLYLNMLSDVRGMRGDNTNVEDLDKVAALCEKTAELIGLLPRGILDEERKHAFLRQID